MPNGVTTQRKWQRAYRARINAGLEHCRLCRTTQQPLTWGHLVARARGGTHTADNVTILCQPCNHGQDVHLLPSLQPLTSEPDFDDIVASITGCDGVDRAPRDTTKPPAPRPREPTHHHVGAPLDYSLAQRLGPLTQGRRTPVEQAP